ncbi:hypothetical protein ACFQ5D_12190 [Paenibacillus farraposensis]|uniref:Uncharacterized protein n=1 Tax=Paenibacillus farraposensis TaxID=2807095 RepID=A0ABW4DEB6_9BACL|nr:hypothetical protein [Paenibacillus farraposensis]
MDMKLARILNVKLGKYAEESTKTEKTIFGAKPVPAELKKKEKN